MQIDEILDRLYQLPASSKAKLRLIVKEVCFSKGYLLMNTRRVEPYIYFLKNGLVRAYDDIPDGEITFWLGTEGDAVLSM